MSYLPYIAGFLVLAYGSKWLVQKLLARRAHRRRAEALGCRPPHLRTHKLPLGIDHITRLLKADKRGQVPDEIEKIFREQGKDTFTQIILGTPQFATANPRNIQALLATQFNDFEIGSHRRLNFAPMLGVGIFTGDGQVW